MRSLPGASSTVHEPRGIVGGDKAVGVDRHDVDGRWYGQVRQRRITGLEPPAVLEWHAPEAAAQQAEVAVEVHRLVRRMREIDVALALEAGEFDVEQARQMSACLSENGLARPIRPQARCLVAVRLCRIAQDALDEEGIGVGGAGGQGEARRYAIQPAGHPLVEIGEPPRLGTGRTRQRQLLQDVVTCGIEGGLKPDRQSTGAIEPCAVALVVRFRRIIDQQDDAAARIVHQGGREESLGDDLLLLLVARNEGQDRRAGGVVAARRVARRFALTVGQREARAGYEVDGRRVEQQQRHPIQHRQLEKYPSIAVGKCRAAECCKLHPKSEHPADGENSCARHQDHGPAAGFALGHKAPPS